MQQALNFDITANRHGGNEQSVAANLVAEPGKAAMRQQIYGYGQTVKDFTLKEVARHFGKEVHLLSGRLSEMKALGLLKPTGETRERCAVLKIAA